MSAERTSAMKRSGPQTNARASGGNTDDWKPR